MEMGNLVVEKCINLGSNFRSLRSLLRKTLEQMLFVKVYREVMMFSQQQTSSHMYHTGTEEISCIFKPDSASVEWERENPWVPLESPLILATPYLTSLSVT